MISSNRFLLERLAACLVLPAAALLLAGCGGGGDDETSGDPTTPATRAAEDHDDADHDHEGEDHDHDGEDHDGEDHDGEDHDGEDHGHAGDDHDHDHGDAVADGTLTIGGSTFEVTVSGELEPRAEMHVDVILTGGADPAAVRLWIGPESAEGARKTRVDLDEHGEAHVHVDAPRSLDGAALWLEVEDEAGERTTGSMTLAHAGG